MYQGYMIFFNFSITIFYKPQKNKYSNVSLVYRFRGWAKSFPLLSRVYTPAEDDSLQKRTAIR